MHGVPQYDHAVHGRALTIAVALVLCAGCSGSDGDGADSWDAGVTGLPAALGRVAANDETRQYVEYGDVASVRKLADYGKPGGQRFVSLLGYGYNSIAPMSVVIAKELRFDPAAMDGAVLVGQPPDQAGLLWGDYDVDAVERALADRHVPAEDSGEGRRWTSAADRKIDFDGPLTGIARASELNVIQTASGSFAVSATQSGVDAVTAPGDDTLADDPVMRRLAGCLGDVTAAMLVARLEGDPISYAAGVRVTPAGAVTEVACLVPPGGDAKAMRDHVESELTDGAVQSTRQPWTELLPRAAAELVEDGSTVRITAKPAADEPAGRVMRLLLTRDLAALAGR